MSETADKSVERAVSTYLDPHTEFPADLGELSLVELQVLHSRLARQLDQEYIDAPEGPHPVTRDRTEQVLVELRAREANASMETTASREPTIDPSRFRDSTPGLPTVPPPGVHLD